MNVASLLALPVFIEGREPYLEPLSACMSSLCEGHYICAFVLHIPGVAPDAYALLL